MYIRFVFILFWIFSLFSSAQAFEIKIQVTGDEITYSFQTATGTLNDLTALNKSGFKFKPDNFGGIKVFVLAGEELKVWQGKHTLSVLEQRFENGIYDAKIRYSYKGDNLDFSLRIYQREKSLVFEYTELSSPGKVRLFGFDRSEQTPDPKIVTLPYGHNVLYSNGLFVSGVLDQSFSNASKINSFYSLFSPSSAYFGDQSEYISCTNGTSNQMRERMILTVSPVINDTFVSPQNPVSSYAGLLRNKVVLDLWGDLRSTLSQLKTFANWGYKDIFAIIHVWQKYGYDNGLPTTYPAADMYGGEPVMREIIDLCEQNDYLFALHTNYVDFYENSDDWNVDDIALNPDGSWIKAWFNQTTQMQSYLIKPQRALKYAQIYEPLIKNNYHTNAAYLDVHSAILPGMKVDFDSRLPDCSKQFSTYDNYLKLMNYVRSVHQGPLAGEGFGYSASVWAGYIDAVEADPRSIKDLSDGIGGSDVPLVVDYKLKILNRLFVPHGVGYLPRFFYEQWKNYTAEQIRSYRLAELAFGNAIFMQDPFYTYPSNEEIKWDYCFVKHIQKYIFSSEVVSVDYFLNNDFVSLSYALKILLPKAEFDKVRKTLRDNLTRLRIRYKSGLILYLNYANTDWNITSDSDFYRLPPGGFLASVPGEFLAYYAAKDGEDVKYYICPAEYLCSTCIEPPDAGFDVLPVDVQEDAGTDADEKDTGTYTDITTDIPEEINDIQNGDAGTEDVMYDITYGDTGYTDIYLTDFTGFDAVITDAEIWPDYVPTDTQSEDRIAEDSAVADIVPDTSISVPDTGNADTSQSLGSSDSGCACSVIE